MRLVRVAVNGEQLLYQPPGGIGRYTAKLLTLLPALFPDDEVVAFTARHTATEISRAWQAAGVPERFGSEIRRDHAEFGYRNNDGAGPASVVAPAVALPLPRPVLYECWNTLGQPALATLSRTFGRLDVVHAPSVAVPPRGRQALVVTVHDVATARFPDSFPLHGRWFHARGLAAAARRADLVITVSHAAAAEIAEYSRIPAGRVRVVPNGVDHVPATAAEIEAARARRSLEGAPYLLWVGTLEPRKNVATLVRAFARLVDSGQAAGHRLVLAGPTGWRNDGVVPADVVERHGGPDGVIRFLGTMAQAELRALYAGATLFALPSLHEGFGLPVLEAMAQATPVVCADIPALAEVAGGAARLVPPEDVDAWAEALAQLLGDDGARARLAAAGRARATEFSWERTVRATRAVYAEAAGVAGVAGPSGGGSGLG